MQRIARANRNAFLITILSLMFAGLTGSASAGTEGDRQRKQCQKLKQAITLYTDRRRAGGSASQMERWRKARRAKKDQWDALDCQKIAYLLD